MNGVGSEITTPVDVGKWVRITPAVFIASVEYGVSVYVFSKIG